MKILEDLEKLVWSTVKINKVDEEQRRVRELEQVVLNRRRT